MPEERDPQEAGNGLEERLGRWFAAETQRAEADLGRGSSALPGRRRRVPVGLVGLGAVVVAIALVAGALTGGFLGSAGSPAPSSLGMASPEPTASPTVATYPDGIPRSVDGQPVLRPAEARDQAAHATDDTPFLLGGWADRTVMFCALMLPRPPAETALLPSCNPTEIGEALGATDGLPVAFVGGASSTAGFPTRGPLIVKVHAHDPLAEQCQEATKSACRQAIVVEAVVWNGPLFGSDGIPTWIEGQPVLRVPAAVARVASATDAEPFLVGGWYNLPMGLTCGAPDSNQPTSPLLPTGCGGPFVTDFRFVQGQSPPPEVGPNPPFLSVVPLDLPFLGFGASDPWPGQIVLRVHTHDPQAAACAPAIRTQCTRAVAVDAVLWKGEPTLALGTNAPSPTNTPLPAAADGIPTEVDGQPVLRGAALRTRIAAASDAAPFLVGGWAPSRTVAPVPCPSDSSVNLGLCLGWPVLDGPGAEGAVEANVPGLPTWFTPPPGVPYVLQAHVTNTAPCPTGFACVRTLTADDLVWLGPGMATSSQPPQATGTSGLPTILGGRTVHPLADLPHLGSDLAGDLIAGFVIPAGLLGPRASVELSGTPSGASTESVHLAGHLHLDALAGRGVVVEYYWLPEVSGLTILAARFVWIEPTP
ncbi:MAG: hypothetical protein ACXWPV_00360 [Candidatus Limnocylindrales bacterium]